MNLNERISKVMEYSGLSSSEFADEVEVQRSSISHITSGRNKPSLEFITKIKSKFPEIEWDWLITGSGEMLKSIENKVEFTTQEEKPKATSLPDLFSLIGDENFGFTEREDKVQKEIARESPISFPASNNEKINDSQRLEAKESKLNLQNIDNEIDKVKRIVLFYESGKFESFEP